jgi:hypothetical protein
VGNKSLPEAGQVVDHRAHPLSQRTASKTELSIKLKSKQETNKTLTAEGADETQSAPEKGGWAKN